MVRILFIDPDTTAIADRLVSAAAGIWPGVEFEGVTGMSGVSYIASRASYGIAGHTALDAWANAKGTFDAVILASFGDFGLDALRELSLASVVGMEDTSLHLALQTTRVVSIVTGHTRSLRGDRRGKRRVSQPVGAVITPGI